MSSCCSSVMVLKRGCVFNRSPIDWRRKGKEGGEEGEEGEEGKEGGGIKEIWRTKQTFNVVVHSPCKSLAQLRSVPPLLLSTSQ